MQADSRAKAQTKTGNLAVACRLAEKLFAGAVIVLVDGIVFFMICLQSIRAEDQFRNPAKRERRIFAAVP